MGPSGRILYADRVPTRPARGPAKVIGAIVAGIRRCLVVPGVGRPGSIGIGIAGQIDREGVVNDSPNLRWHRVPLRATVERAVGLPVRVTNDLRAITFGEWRFGAGRGVSELVCVFLGTGVGGGVVAGGELRYGASDTAGEVGHMTLVANGRACRCPNRGCVEAYVGGWAIARRARELARREPRRARAMVREAGGLSRLGAASIARGVRRRDPFALALRDEVAEALGDALVSLINGFDPALIVLGGGVIDGIPSLVGLAARRARARALPLPVRRLRIVRAALGPKAGVLGAAAMARLGVPGGI